MSSAASKTEPAEAPAFRDDDERWEVVKRRDPNADGAFYFSVRTTGVYCRPSCPSKRARRENIAFHPSRFALGQCSLGAVLVAATDKGVCAIQFGDDPDALLRDLQEGFPKARLIGGDADFERLVAKVVALVETPYRTSELPLDIRGTAFQQQVWQALRGIPAGSTASYREIASRIGRPKAARAVARACAANKIAVAIPCHRVVRTGGRLSGYRWGVARKRALLETEGAL